MKKCLIISGGEFSGFEKLTDAPHRAAEPELSIAGGKISDYGLIIAADKGAIYAGRLGIFPDVVIGDFDSCEEAAASGQFNHQSFAAESKREVASSGDPAAESKREVASAGDPAAGEEAAASGQFNHQSFAAESKREVASSGDPAAGEEAAAPEIIRLPREKDYSDTFFAVKYALERGFLNIDFICIMGGRFDHMLSNLQTAAYAASYGARCRLLGESDIIHVICGEDDAKTRGDFPEPFGDDAKTRGDFPEPFGQVTIKKRAGWSVSAFALSERCEGVRISGSKYDNGAKTTSLEVEGAEKGAASDGLTLCSTLPQGLSNEFAEGSAEIVYSLKRGVLAVVESGLR